MKKTTIIVTIFVFLTPALALAQGYVPIVGIPGLPDVNTDFNSYINTLYGLSISIAALLAVIKIVIAGVKWMMSDIVTDKGSAKKDIQGALLGLLVILGAVLILEVINPDIKNVNLNFDEVAIKNPAAAEAPDEELNPALVLPGGEYHYLSPKASPAQLKAFEKDCKSRETTEFRLRAQPSQPRCYTKVVGKNIIEINNTCDEDTSACLNSADEECKKKGGDSLPDPHIPTLDGKTIKGVICYYKL